MTVKKPKPTYESHVWFWADGQNSALEFCEALLESQQLRLSVELGGLGSYLTKTSLSLHSPVLEVNNEVAMHNGG